MSFKIGRLVELGTIRGEPVEVDSRRLVPIARIASVTLRRSGALAAGFVWARPVAVEVTDAAGRRRVPIPDVGMRVALAAAVLGVSVVLARALQRAGRQ